MSKLVITKNDGEIVEFDGVIGHQIGNGAVQVMMKDGTQHVFNNFIEVFVDLDDADKKGFKKRIEEAEAAAEAKMNAEQPKVGGKKKPKPKLKAVALDS